MDQSHKFPNTLIIIFGVPGSGKSWASRDIRKILPSQSYLIEADKIEQLINCGLEISQDLFKDTSSVEESTSFSQEAWKKSRSIVFDAVKQFLSDETNLTILLDDDFLLRSQRKHYFHLCCDIGVNYVEVLMNTELDVILQRNAERVGNKQLPQDVLTNFYQKLERQPINKEMFILSDDLDLKHIELASQRTKEFLHQRIKNPKQLDSELHQFDCSLRQIIGLIMKSHDVRSFMAGIRVFFSGSPDETFMNEVEQIWQRRKDPVVLHKMKKEYLGLMGQQEIKQLTQQFIIGYYNLL